MNKAQVNDIVKNRDEKSQLSSTLTVISVLYHVFCFGSLETFMYIIYLIVLSHLHGACFLLPPFYFILWVYVQYQILYSICYLIILLSIFFIRVDIRKDLSEENMHAIFNYTLHLPLFFFILHSKKSLIWSARLHCSELYFDPLGPSP